MSALFEVDAEPEAPEMVPLRGTEKQCAWAETVRKKLLGSLAQHLREWRLLIERYQSSGKDAEKLERARREYRAAVDRCGEIEAQAYAGWWLDRRENTARELLNDAPPKPGGLTR